MKTLLAKIPVVIVPLALLAGCGSNREVVRGSNDPSIDNPAMSTGIDKDDSQRALHTLLNSMRTAPVMEMWRADRGQDTVAIAPFLNDTSEHIDSQLNAMLDETETWLVKSGTVTVISKERQLQMIREVEGSHHPVFNPAHIPQYGRQLGIKYYITGKIRGNDERTADTRRVQYQLFMQVIEVETGAIRWQETADITKMIR